MLIDTSLRFNKLDRRSKDCKKKGKGRCSVAKKGRADLQLIKKKFNINY